ncbi:MAG: RHS repeat-associated core domain-containing protein [Actinomycetota bacterium]
MTERWEAVGSGSITSEASDESAVSGMSGTRTATSTNSGNWIGQLVSLQPAAASQFSTRYSDDAVLDASNAVIERTDHLVGGAFVTKRTGVDVWSYPNLHDAVAATAEASGIKQGPTWLYDPYGEALSGLPDNGTGNFDFAWAGGAQRGLEHGIGLSTIEMDARSYSPSLGRFHSVDPVFDGSPSSYAYVFGDPINESDFDGRTTCPCWSYVFKHYWRVTAGHQFWWWPGDADRHGHWKFAMRSNSTGTFEEYQEYSSGRRSDYWTHKSRRTVVNHYVYYGFDTDHFGWDNYQGQMFDEPIYAGFELWAYRWEQVPCPPTVVQLP